ncbi:uncharacterized protein LOC124769099 [Schistocerca piceifrons]|uniref:uncharacterized protein LOC124769099 n=1 Tax=Schistocerca piceifrons TaxID=274613 RepID=UPI001F5F7149|nr:uncharacterized protein LOC124769099 [Schistocerca piceifrons]
MSPVTYRRARSWSVPCNLPLADPEFNKPATVDLILGAEVFFDVVCKERLVKPSHPSLVETRFGWILSGRMPSAACNMPRSTVTLCFVRGDNLDAKLQRFWELEELSTKTMSGQDKICEAHFQRHTARDEEGRFVVRLPVKPDCKSLGKSRQQASRRLAHLERRFKRQPKLQKEYAAFMHEYVELGHMEISNPQGIIGPRCYLPHHAVFKECSSTTKLRVVFDGSAATSNGVSLNDILMVGPTVQPDLFSIIIKFRSFNVALSAGIAKTYRQVSLHPDDRNFQRILWRESPSEPMQEYRLCTLTYGTAPAAFLATRCLQQLALENQNKFPMASQALIVQLLCG